MLSEPTDGRRSRSAPPEIRWLRKSDSGGRPGSDGRRSCTPGSDGLRKRSGGDGPNAETSCGESRPGCGEPSLPGTSVGEDAERTMHGALCRRRIIGISAAPLGCSAQLPSMVRTASDTSVAFG